MVGKSKGEGEGVAARESGINNSKELGDDRAHVWRMVSNPVWLEQRTGCIEYWISNVSLYYKDSAVL